jgi:hypothetical protein
MAYDLFDGFDLGSVLAEPTKPRTQELPKVDIMDQFSDLVFDDVPETKDAENSIRETEHVQEVEEEEEDYDPAQQAENLVAVISSANLLLLTPLAKWKLRKKRGGREVIAAMQLAFEKKESAGLELSAEEQIKYNKYTAYLKDKAELLKEIPYTDEEEAQLQKMAEVWMKSSKMKVGDSLAFWMTLAGIQGSRIFAILEV